MKNLTKNSVANVAKVGVASALIGAGLFLSACGGGDEFKPSSEAEKKAVALAKEKYPNTKFLSYEYMNKEILVSSLQSCQIANKNSDTAIYLYSKSDTGTDNYELTTIDLQNNVVLDKQGINRNCIKSRYDKYGK